MTAKGESDVKTSTDDERISRVIFHYAARIGQEQDTDALLRLNADMARDLVGADRCSIWLVNSAAHQLYTKVAHGGVRSVSRSVTDSSGRASPTHGLLR
jgi:GAF domain-containing protein